MASFKFHGKNYWESSKLKNSKITPSREIHAHFISCKPPHKNHPREYFGTTLCFIQIATSVVEKSQFLSVAFHLATTVLTLFGVQRNHTVSRIYCHLLQGVACGDHSWACSLNGSLNRQTMDMCPSFPLCSSLCTQAVLWPAVHHLLSSLHPCQQWYGYPSTTLIVRW